MMEQQKTTSAVSFGQKLISSRYADNGNEHCYETVAEHNGITWVNHSIATTVDITWNALRELPGPVVLIIGGIDRGNDYAPLVDLVGKKVKAMICLGSTREKFFTAFSKHTPMIVHAADIREAVQFASMIDGNDHTVLFAPSCPSYHAFDNYKNRGNEFRRIVGEVLSANNNA